MRSSPPLPACGLHRRLTSLVLRKRGPGGAVLPKKQRVNIFLDARVIEHFKTKAGAHGYLTLIYESLKQAIQAEAFEGIVSRVAVMARP